MQNSIIGITIPLAGGMINAGGEKQKQQFTLNTAGRATTLEVEGMEFTRVP
jgi:hypothetical protein